jgi:hypothetical protein
MFSASSFMKGDGCNSLGRRHPEFDSAESGQGRCAAEDGHFHEIAPVGLVFIGRF